MDSVLAFLLWLRSYLVSWNILWFGITLATWLYFQPALETCRTFQVGWIARMFIRNMALLWIVYGGWHLYPAMMMAITRGLEEAGVNADRVHTESFNQNHPHNGQGPLTSAQHAVTFTRSNKTFRWDSEFKNLLEFAESNGIAMEAGCMFGECGPCSVKVAQGEVDYNYPSTQEDRAHGFARGCAEGIDRAIAVTRHQGPPLTYRAPAGSVVCLRAVSPSPR